MSAGRGACREHANSSSPARPILSLSVVRRNDRSGARLPRRPALARSVIELRSPIPASPMFAATILTLFPAMFPGPLGQSLAGEALARSLWSLEARDIREHGLGRHRAVDDTPAGGGPGMVMRADVLAASLDAAVPADDPRPRLIMSPRGERFTQARARQWAAEPGLVVVCPRFEGFDERIVAG